MQRAEKYPSDTFGACDVNFYGNRDFADVIKQGVLRQEVILDCLGRP